MPTSEPTFIKIRAAEFELQKLCATRCLGTNDRQGTARASVVRTCAEQGQLLFVVDWGQTRFGPMSVHSPSVVSPTLLYIWRLWT